MIFVPHTTRICSVNSENLAKEIWDEKERRERSAREELKAKRRKSKTEAYYKKISWELGEALTKGEEI